MCALVTGVQTCALPIFGFMTRRLMGAAGVDWLPRPGSEPDPGRAAIAKRTVIAANMLRVAPVREEGGMKPGRTTMNESAIRQLDASMTADSNWSRVSLSSLIGRPADPFTLLDRKSVVSGKSVSVRVDLGGRRIIKKKNNATEK